jgi:DNA-binding MarR family transcriptional regulator
VLGPRGCAFTAHCKPPIFRGMGDLVDPNGTPGTEPQPVEIVAAMRDVSRVLQSYLVAQARSTGLQLLELLVLVRAAEADGITARDAGRAYGLNTSTMTGLADRLEHEGLIRRHQHPSDRRVLLLKATPKGRDSVQRAHGQLFAELEQLVEGLSADQRSSLKTILADITTIVDGQARSAQPQLSRRGMARRAT